MRPCVYWDVCRHDERTWPVVRCCPTAVRQAAGESSTASSGLQWTFQRTGGSSAGAQAIDPCEIPCPSSSRAPRASSA